MASVSKVKIWSFVILLIAIVYFIGEIRGKKFREQILENPVIVNATVSNYWVAYKRSESVDYSFIYNKQTYYSTSPNGNYFWLRHDVVGKNFPVIINSLHPEHNQILILPEEFKEYKVPFPDSLNWVKELIDNK